jgi:hypothetical protein
MSVRRKRRTLRVSLTVGAFASSSRRTLAIFTIRRQVVATGDCTECNGQLWAVGQNAAGTQADLVIVNPPAA